MIINKTEKELEGNNDIQGTSKPKLFDWFLLNNGHNIPLILKFLGFIVLLLISLYNSFKIVQYLFPDKDIGSIIVAMMVFTMLTIAQISFMLIISSIILILIKPKKLIEKISKSYRVWKILNFSYIINEKYYSVWYIILFNRKLINSNFKPKSFSYKDISFFNSILSYEYKNLIREERKHWTNSIKTNQILSFKDYYNLMKKQKKINKINKMNKDIEKFQKYYNLK